VLWSADGATLVAVGEGRRWHVVAIAADGTATERIVRLPGDVFLPAPILGSLSIPSEEPRTVAIGFSADGRWIYGGIVSAHIGTLVGAFRVALDGSRAERVLSYRVGEPDGLLPESGTFGGRLVDPVHGRLANWRSNADTSGGPPTVEVREADSTFVFAVDDGAPLGSGWGANGDLYVLSADTLLFPNKVTLRQIGSDGATVASILETGPLTSASFIGLRDGYAALAAVTTRPTDAAQLLLVDLAAPERIAATPIVLAPDPAIIGADLIPAAGSRAGIGP
jgi:hypothetical protein